MERRALIPNVTFSPDSDGTQKTKRAEKNRVISIFHISIYIFNMLMFILYICIKILKLLIFSGITSP